MCVFCNHQSILLWQWQIKGSVSGITINSLYNIDNRKTNMDNFRLVALDYAIIIYKAVSSIHLLIGSSTLPCIFFWKLILFFTLTAISFVGRSSSSAAPAACLSGVENHPSHKKSISFQCFFWISFSFTP